MPSAAALPLVPPAVATAKAALYAAYVALAAATVATLDYLELLTIPRWRPFNWRWQSATVRAEAQLRALEEQQRRHLEENVGAAGDVLAWLAAIMATGGINFFQLQNYTVYVIRDMLRMEPAVVYVGITNDYPRRFYDHQLRPRGVEGIPNYPINQYQMMPIQTDLTLAEARTLENILIAAHVFDALDNMRYEIAHRRLHQFQVEYQRMRNLMFGRNQFRRP